jgi:hypothetical protein
MTIESPLSSLILVHSSSTSSAGEACHRNPVTSVDFGRAGEMRPICVELSDFGRILYVNSGGSPVIKGAAAVPSFVGAVKRPWPRGVDVCGYEA